MKAEIGDKMLRILPPSDNWEAWVSDAEVIEVTEEEITCIVYVDIPRKMKFDRRTGRLKSDETQFIIAKPI